MITHIRNVTAWIGLVIRKATTVTPLWPVENVIYTRVGYLPELVFSLLIKIQKVYLDTLKQEIFLY